MSNPVSLAKEQLRSAVDAAIAALISEGALPEGDLRDYNIEVPADRKNGDFSVNAAMVNAKVFRMAPRKSAELIAGKLSLDGTYFDRAEVAGPGFLNFYLSGRYYADILLNIHDEGDHYGRSNYGEGKKVLVEFVSANPTGPHAHGQRPRRRPGRLPCSRP